MELSMNGYKKPSFKCLFFILAFLVCSCGAGQAQETVAVAKDPDQTAPQKPGNAMAAFTKDHDQTEISGDMEIEGLRGTIPQGEVQRVFNDHMDQLLDCYSESIEDLEEIEGALEIAMEIGGPGNVNHAYMRSADLGSLETEKCILRKVERFKFRKQGGGTVDIAYPFELEAPYDPPNPIVWKRSTVEEVVNQHMDDLERCLNGKTGVVVTIYIGLGGVVASAGASADEYEMYDEAICLAEAVRAWAFPDPGSRLAKISLEL
jgi:hypothetical protein